MATANTSEQSTIVPPFLSPELPPLVVVVVGVSLSGEDGPSPLVDEVAEREEGDLLQGHLQQEVQLSPCGCQ